MTHLLHRLPGVLVLCLIVLPAFAADELVVYTLRDGVAAQGLTVRLSGSTDKTTGREGYAVFDLSGGAHSIQILENDKPLHSFRFNSANKQLTDIVINFVGEQVEITDESYYRIESAADRLDAPKGLLSGRVQGDGQALAGATLSVEGTDVSVTTDANGRYSLELPRGVYDLHVEHPDFETSDISDLRVVSNVNRAFTFTLSRRRAEEIGPEVSATRGAGLIEEVVVTASYRPGAYEPSERDTLNVIDTLGIEQLARFGDANVAASVVRVPSVTIQEGKFIFIRGLGDRYITSTLNNATMPSTDPSKRTVPLDLFPSNIVSQLDIKKTFIASMPGESTGGNLVINTRTFPDKRDGKVSVSVSGIGGLTDEDVFVDPSHGEFDWLGWDDGTREEPIAVTAIAKALANRSVVDPDTGGTFQLSQSAVRELQRLGALLLKDDLDIDKLETATPKVSISANYGDLYNIRDAELGIFVAANYKNGWSMKDDGVNASYTLLGEPLDDFKFQEYSNNVDISGLISIGLNIGDSIFEANTIISRSTTSKVKRAVGQEGDEFQAQIRHTIDWVERQYLSQQISGSHLLNESGTLTVDWQATASQARRDAPDRREVLFNAASEQTDPNALLAGFDLDELNNEQKMDLNGFRLEPNQLLRRYDELTDDNFDVSADFSWEVVSSGYNEANLNFGAQGIHRERDADSASYGFNIPQSLVALSVTPNILVSDVLIQANITGDQSTGYVFSEKTLASDSYEAELDLNSAYVSYDHMFGDHYQVIVGVRYEDYEQTTDTFSLQGAQPPVQSLIKEDVWLPTLGFNWFFKDDMQLRFAVSKTVARPDFKESSNATFYDTEFDFRVRGNPFLSTSEIINYDLRYEWYFSDTESLSVALFYKDMKDPIERVLQPASGTAGNSRTFRNADSGELYGAEVELRKEFALNDAYTKSAFVATNAAWIESEVQLEGQDKRELQGQPKYTFNLILGYDDIVNGHELTLLVNQNGKSIKDVGVAGLADVIEEPRLDVKLNYKYQLRDDISVSASIDNLLDDEVEFTQGGRTFQSYKKGIEFDLGVDWSF